MQRERVADDICVFTSDLYAQVTAGVVMTSEGAVVIDTLAYPEETLLIKRFIETRLGTTVRYVINTHFHADHSTGTCFFKGSRVVSHALCRELLDTRGRSSLEKSKAANEMRDVELVLPDIVFSGGPFVLHVGNKTFQMWSTPGHSADSIVCLVKEDRVLFAADTLMPIPYFVDGNFDDFVASLNSLRNGNYENVIQGHGEIVLRGEVEDKIRSDIEYLHKLRDAVDQALTKPFPDAALEAIDIESCGKSRILLNGAVPQLHRRNVLTLAAQRRELVQL
ncbi:MAG: MBL fold metallo-hydrolase [Anaerolineae bacterium]|nr:MBL fold metallo-hydrolase [Anaerolineae bacterium]